MTEPNLRDAAYVVEATDAERFFLWRENHEGAHRGRVRWEQAPGGYMHTVGHISVNRKRMPVTVCVYFAILDGHLIAFYDSTSQVVDHRMVEAWVKAESPAMAANKTCDAMNFAHCVQHLHTLGGPMNRRELPEGAV